AGGALNPRMSVRSIVQEPLVLEKRLSAVEQRERVDEVIDLVRLPAAMGEMYPHQLGGGEQQRVGIARALATGPDLVVLDEPTSALDVSLRAEILDLLSDLRERLGISYLCISHDLTAVRRICGSIAIMYLGKMVEAGPTEEIFSRQLHPYSRSLLGSVLYPDPKQQPSALRLKGEIPSPIDLPLGCYLSARCPTAREECKISYPPMQEVLPGRWVSCFRAEEGGSLDPLLDTTNKK
ncbi:ABC transporter ATP-binding protein, partial [Candidatus Bathyarchaeota archaeon]|nr:ABC transporter ATP-binding protein [Candidatus Bathyarchaeota archaeon]